MAISKKELGDYGERVARKYLETKKYEIIESNYNKRGGEIDIIGRSNDGQIVFFEVKTRTRYFGKYGLPEEAVNYFKQKKILKTAEIFLFEKGIDPLETNWRFDVIVVMIDRDRKKVYVRQIKNAFSG